jgi:hypothetical protein
MPVKNALLVQEGLGAVAEPQYFRIIVVKTTGGGITEWGGDRFRKTEQPLLK